MQGFTDAPRQNFSRQNVLDVLGWAANVGFDIGMEILDSSNNPVLDVSGYLVQDPSSKIARQMSDEVQGTVSFLTEYNHNWGLDRVRPYCLLANPAKVPNGPVRFDLGIFLVTTNGQPLGDGTPIFPVTGYDLNYLLTNVIGDTYSIGAGTLYFSAIALTLGEAFGLNYFQLNLDSTKATAVLPNDMVWPMAQDSNGTRWIDVINDLLKAINYRPVWVDQTGAFRSEPDIDAAIRPVEFIFGAGNTPAVQFLDPNWQYHGIVSDDNRSITRDTWNVPNRWRFIQNDLTFEPIEGSGQFTWNNVDGGPTSQNAIGRVIQGPAQYVSASSQADLVAQATKVIQNDIYVTETVKFSSSVLPIAGHYDILQYMDPTLPGLTLQRKLVVQSWQFPLFSSTGGEMSWEAISTPPEAAYWNTGQSGTSNAQPVGGGGPGAPYELPYRPGQTYLPPTPPPTPHGSGV
jgi:hypothetical protein